MKLDNTWYTYHTVWLLTVITLFSAGTYSLVRGSLNYKPLDKNTTAKCSATPCKEVTVTKTPTATSTPTPLYVSIPETIIYPSQDSSKYFYFTYIDNTNKCFFNVKDKYNNYYDLKTLIGFNEGECGRTMSGTLLTSYIGWRGNQLLLKPTPGKILIANLDEKTTQTYEYDYKDREFIDVNNALSYWIFYKGMDESGHKSVVATDRNNNVITTNIFEKENDSYGLSQVMYDDVNDGFLVIKESSKPIDAYHFGVSFRFGFLSADQSYRTILTTDYASVMPRDCGGSWLVSEPNEVILRSSCVVVNDNYLGNDHGIHLKLN